MGSFSGSPISTLPPPHVLCISLSWLSVTLATSGHTDVSMGTSGPGLGQEGDSCVQPGPPQGMRYVCGPGGESGRHSQVVLGTCPWSGRGLSHPQSPLLGDVRAEGSIQITHPGASRCRVCG